MILILEIGGTHARHVLIDINNGIQVSDKIMLMSGDFFSFEAYLNHVLKLL